MRAPFDRHGFCLGFAVFVTLFSLAYGVPCKSSIYVMNFWQNSTQLNKDYPSQANTFFRNCFGAGLASKREQVGLLLPPYAGFTPCFLGNKGDCDSIQISSNDVVLVANEDHELPKVLDKLLTTEAANSGCIDDSMGVIITDIPCESYADYPDMDALWGDDSRLNDTINKFKERYRLHTVVMWLSPDSENLTSCEHFRTYYDTEFNNKTDYLELMHVTYKELPEQGSICNKGFERIPHPGSLNNGTSGMPPALKFGIIGGSSAIGLIILGVIAFFAFRIRRRYLESKIDMFAEEHASRARRLFFGDVKPLDEWEITPKELKVEADILLGTGVAGSVYKGHLKKKRDGQVIEMDVAVKVAHSYADQSVRKDMIREIEFMKTLGKHENLLVMVGYVKDPENPVIATEFCVHGDLLKILRRHDLHFLTSEKCTETDVCLLLADLLRIASQVCAGMAHLAELNYVHRDLAARNVMIMGDLTAKVGDFGLCRTTSESLYIQKGGKLPIKHMSYEALKFGEFSEKSDVWSYGILLFEMFTGGERPFADVETEELIKHLEAEGRPEFPEEVPDQLMKLLNMKCFSKNAEERGTFAEIKEEIDRIVEMFYI